MTSNSQKSDNEKAITDEHLEGSDIPAEFRPADLSDYVRREEMIPMRDGVKLHTVIMIPKGASDAPLMLERTPYNASKLTRLTSGPQAVMQMYAFHGDLISAGYIVVIQDIRGKFKSEGRYVMNLALRGNHNDGDADHSTDAWDTIEWLVNNVPESNGRVGTIGISYDGFTALMSLVDPHPALKACVPINPMVDNWKGDDWFHNGAFRQSMTAQYVYVQTSSKNSELHMPMPAYDDYETWLTAGSASAGGRLLGLDRLPFWERLSEHPDYDDFWSEQAVDTVLEGRQIEVPVLNVHSQWDAEDIYGPMAVHAVLEKDRNTRPFNFLAIGPWSHAGVGFDGGYDLGPLKFGGDTAKWFRREVMLRFLGDCLKDSSESPDISRVTAFETGTNEWQRYETWPPAGSGADAASTLLYLGPEKSLTFDEPVATDESQFDEYVSDPGKPVTYQQRPIRPKMTTGSNWDDWLVEDQRFAGDRPDVLTYCSSTLDEIVRLAGQPVARLFASTSGEDCDWVVKLIDVFPDQVPDAPELGGYQLPIAMDILRGRYRDDPSSPSAVPSNEIVEFCVPLPHVSHAFMPGHRIMVQIQSTWFPLYDRNPQSWVENIFFATPGDFQKATQRVFRNESAASHIELPIIKKT